MKHFFTLFSQCIHKLLNHASTYFIAACFLALMGFIFAYSLFLDAQGESASTCLQNLFEIFWLPTLCFIPLITMRTLSEEQRSGMLENLLVTPVSTFEIVLSKCLAVYFFYLLLWGLCFCFPFIAQKYSQGEIISPLILQGGAIFTLLSSFLFISLGIFASSLTRTQTLAGFLAFSFLFLMLVGTKTLCDAHFVSYRYSVYINFFEFLDQLCCGLLDLRPLLFCFCGGFLFLILTTTVLESKILR